ncbi:MAG: carboxyl transferase domain-containing protein [Clostridia bacterium]
MAGLDLLEKNSQKLYASSGKIREFLNNLLDEQSFVETDVFLSGDSALYGEVPFGEGVVTGYGAIDGHPVCIAIQNPEVLGGSLGYAHAKKILKIAKRALGDNLPLISIIDSAGVRIGEGLTALDAFAELIGTINKLRKTSTHIAVINGTATGLMSVYAGLSDCIFISENGSLSLSPPASVSAKAGHDKKAVDVLGVTMHSNTSGLASFSYKDSNELRTSLSYLLPFINEQIIVSSDDPNRTAAALNTDASKNELLLALADNGKYLEVNAGYAEGISTVLATVNSVTVGIVVVDGKVLDKKAIKKIKNFIKFLNKYNITLINLVDSEGATSSLQDEECGIVKLAAKLCAVVSSSDIAKISVIIGSAIGFAYTTLCSKAMGYEYVLAFPNAKLSPLTADAAISFLNKEQLVGIDNALEKREELKRKYEQEETNPFVSAKDGGVDNIIEPALLRPYIASALTLKIR